MKYWNHVVGDMKTPDISASAVTIRGGLTELIHRREAQNMDEEKVMARVLGVVNDCGRDSDLAAKRLMEMAEEDPELMIAFVEHGVEILRSVAQGALATKH